MELLCQNLLKREDYQEDNTIKRYVYNNMSQLNLNFKIKDFF
jgi:hypothetical protein